jgi:hypothetical protein
MQRKYLRILTYKGACMEKNTNDEIEIDLVDIFYLLRSRLWIIILSGIILDQPPVLSAVFY